MTLQRALQERNISIYRLSKASGVPYATVNDICNGKAQLNKCSAETVFRLSKALDISMEELLSPEKFTGRCKSQVEAFLKKYGPRYMDAEEIEGEISV